MWKNILKTSEIESLLSTDWLSTLAGGYTLLLCTLLASSPSC